MEKRERQYLLLKYVSDGLTAEQIGAKMKLSPRTVEKHLELIRASHEAKNAAELIAIAFRKGLIT